MGSSGFAPLKSKESLVKAWECLPRWGTFLEWPTIGQPPTIDWDEIHKIHDADGLLFLFLSIRHQAFAENQFDTFFAGGDVFR